LVFGIAVASCTVQDQDQLVRSVMNADRAFSDYSQAQGRNESFMKYCAKDAVLLRDNSYPVEGIAKIDSLISLQPDTSYTLTWEPVYGDVASSGELGYTYGIWTLSIKGSPDIFRGTYATIWKKENGEWKWVLDSGNDGLEAPSEN